MNFFKKNWSAVFLAAIFISAFFLLIFSAKLDSQTTDEGIHLFSGYSYLVKKDFRLDSEHPPFLKELGAVPILFFLNLDVKWDEVWDKAGAFYYDSWQEARILGENFFYVWQNNPETLLFWGRLPFIFLTLLLGFFSYIWAKKLYGEKAGVFAAFLTLFFPNILAHGRLINSDLGVTLFIFMAVYFWGVYLKKPTIFNLTLAGLFLGLTLASKFTGFIIIPVFIILFILKILFFNPPEKSKPRAFLKYLFGFFAAIFLAFMSLWASYGFILKVPPALPQSFIGEPFWQDFLITSERLNLIEKLKVVFFPAELYKGLYLMLRHAANGHGSFLLGQNSNQGWWYYFLVTIFYKTPIPFFIFLGLAIGFWRKLRTKNLFDEVLLILPPLFYLTLSSFSKTDLGVRHILPIFPFLLVFASKSINLVDFKKFLPAIGFLVLIFWYLFSMLANFPNFLAYFNEFSGGSKNRYKILTDSNLDWGQDIYRLKNYLKENNIDKIYIVYPWDGDAALNYYGINFEPLYPDDQNIKGKVVISATYLQTEAYSWLKKYPFRQITPGLFIFNLH